MHRLPDLLTLLRLQQLQEEGSTLKRQPTVGTILKLSFFFFQLFISGWDGVGVHGGVVKVVWVVRVFRVVWVVRVVWKV